MTSDIHFLVCKDMSRACHCNFPMKQKI